MSTLARPRVGGQNLPCKHVGARERENLPAALVVLSTSEIKSTQEAISFSQPNSVFSKQRIQVRVPLGEYHVAGHCIRSNRPSLQHRNLAMVEDSHKIESGPEFVALLPELQAAGFSVEKVDGKDMLAPDFKAVQGEPIRRDIAGFPPSHEELMAAAEIFVKGAMKGWDSSHDWWHAERVRRLAVSLAEEEGLSKESRDLVEVAALLHDVGDHKYATRESGGPQAIEKFLEEQGYPAEKSCTVMIIITRMGFKEELSGEMNNGVFPELAVVQDADRLEAIGAIGIARCLTFGGSRNRVLHNPESSHRENLSKEEYALNSAQSTTIHHFYEKLLKLKDMMKTESGRRRAEGRHKFMEDFLSRFYEEWDGKL